MGNLLVRASPELRARFLAEHLFAQKRNFSFHRRGFRDDKVQRFREIAEAPGERSRFRMPVSIGVKAVALRSF